MSAEHFMPRRASLKSLVALGAGMASGMAARGAAHQADPASPGTDGAETGSVVDVAVARMTKGRRHSCAQAVFSAFAERMGMDHETAVKLTAGFGGGMHLGGPCGAVSGAIMAIGLKYGGLSPNMQVTKLAQEFAERFKARHRSIYCPDLIGVDLSKPEGMAAAQDMKAFVNCPRFVEDAARILEALLKETQPA